VSAGSPPFTGFFLNLGGGDIIASFDSQEEMAISIPTILNIVDNDNKNLYDASSLGSFGLGYKQQITPYFVIGLTATADIEDAKISNNKSFQETMSQLQVSKNLTAKLKNTFALLIKPSFIIARKNLLYVLVGPRWGNFRVLTKASYSQNLGFGNIMTNILDTHNSGYKVGIAAGLGVEQYFCHGISLGLEYAFTSYGNIPISNAPNTLITVNGAALGTAKNKVKIKAYSNAVLVNFGYLFS